MKNMAVEPDDTALSPVAQTGEQRHSAKQIYHILQWPPMRPLCLMTSLLGAQNLKLERVPQPRSDRASKSISFPLLMMHG